MKKSLFAIATAAIMSTAAFPAIAQTDTTTTTTWTTDQGAAITAYSTTQKEANITDPTMQPDIGYVLPGTVTVYSLPATMKVPDQDRYSYGLINGHTVLIDRATRKVVHIWN
jgi:hypothetical protein